MTIGVVTTLVLVLSSTASPSMAAETIPILWEAGGLSAGTFSAGQAARITSDAQGNVTVVSGPADGSQLRVTSHTASGQLRWVNSVSPTVGTFQGDWVAAAPGGDTVVVGHNVTSRGAPISMVLVRFSPDGALRWRIDINRTLPYVAKLIVDAEGNSYLAFSSVIDGQDMQIHKYGASGALLWSQIHSPGGFSNEYASSMALSPDGTQVVVTGSVSGGAEWITASYDASTGARRWLVSAPVGIAARDVVIDASRVYVTGQGNIGIESYVTVVAYARSSGAQLWRTNTRPATNWSGAAGLRIALAPDGSLVVTGQAGLFLDWYTVAFEATGSVRWAARRDARSDRDEIPVGVFMLPDGTAVVTGPGGPALPGGYVQGVTAGYGPNGTPLWEAFSRLATTWATPLPNGDVCATGGYDALVTCWRIPGAINRPPTAIISAAPISGTAPLTVHLDGSGSSDADGSVVSWGWNFGDGGTGTGPLLDHVYTTQGSYTATLTVTDDAGASGSATMVINVGARQPASINVGSTTGGSVGGVTFADEDIVSLDPATGRWQMRFDGSDVGLGSADIDAAELLSDGRWLFSTEAPVVLGGVTYDDSDVISFTPISTGAVTAGTFGMYKAGSAIGLTTNAEDVDAIAIAPSGGLVLSTAGRLWGGGIVAEDEDLVRVTGTALSLYLDGSALELTDATEDVWGASIATDGRLDLSMQGGFSLSTGVSGGPATVVSCTPTSPPPVVACDPSSLLAPAALGGFGSEVIDALSVSG